MFQSPNGNTNFFNIVAGVLQEDTFAPYLFILGLDYIIRTSIDLTKENDFTKKAKSLKNPTESVTDGNYANDWAFLANRLTQAKSQQHSLEWAVGGISLSVKVNKTEYMCFKQKGAISGQSGNVI